MKINQYIQIGTETRIIERETMSIDDTCVKLDLGYQWFWYYDTDDGKSSRFYFGEVDFKTWIDKIQINKATEEDFVIGNTLAMKSAYGGAYLEGKVVAISVRITLSFERGHHTESYDKDELYKLSI